jgi:hypothetical protein
MKICQVNCVVGLLSARDDVHINWKYIHLLSTGSVHILLHDLQFKYIQRHIYYVYIYTHIYIHIKVTIIT